MGDSVKLPAYVYADKDRHGRVRYRFRKAGLPSRTINAKPDTRAFRDAYNAALDGETPKPVAKNSFEQVAGEYLHYLAKLVDKGHAAPATLKQRRLLLAKITAKHGQQNALTISPRDVKFIISELAVTPALANNTLKTLRAMYKWIVAAGKMDADPTAGVQRIQYKTTGFTPWTLQDLRQFARRHPPGSTAYTCAILALCTGGRRGDICRLGPKNLTTVEGVKFIRYTQEKGGKDVYVPVLPLLDEALAAIEIVNAAAFVPNGYGKPFTKFGLGGWFADRVKESGLSGLGLHGLRKAQGVLLAEMGCTQYEIMAIQGHSDPKSSAIYTQSASRMKLAVSAMDKASGFKL